MILISIPLARRPGGGAAPLVAFDATHPLALPSGAGRWDFAHRAGQYKRVLEYLSR